jgi:hypothetical protein
MRLSSLLSLAVVSYIRDTPFDYDVLQYMQYRILDSDRVAEYSIQLGDTFVL